MNPNYNCFLVKPDASFFNGKIHHDCVISFDGSAAIPLVDFLKYSQTIPIYGKEFHSPITKKRFTFRFVNNQLGYSKKNKIQKVVDFSLLQQSKASHLYALLSDIFINTEISLDLRLSLLEMSKTPEKQFDYCNPQLFSLDFDANLLKGKMEQVSQTLIFDHRQSVYPSPHIGYTRKEDNYGFYIIHPFDSTELIENFHSSLSIIVDLTYSCLLQLVIIKDQVDPNLFPEIFLEKYLDWMDEEFSSIYLYELTLAISIIGKSNSKPVLKPKAYEGDIYLIRNASWDLCQFSLFEIMSNVADCGRQHYFVTHDTGLASFLLAFSKMKKARNISLKPNFAQLCEDLKFGDQNSKYNKILDLLDRASLNLRLNDYTNFNLTDLHATIKKQEKDVLLIYYKNHRKTLAHQI